MLFILSFHDEIIPILTHIRKMALGIWIYNTVFFIVPTFMGSFNDIGLTSKLLSTERSTKPFVFISTNAIAIQNQLEYEDAIQMLNTNSKKSKTNAEVKISEGQFLIGQNPNEMRQDSFSSPRRRLQLYKMVRSVCASH